VEQQRKIILKIQKLLQLADTSKNSNLEEAASAAAKAQKLMEKHRIKKAMLNQVGHIAWRPLEDKGNPGDWKLYLVSHLAKNNGCYVVRSENYEEDNKINIVGEEQDHETVQQLYTYLVNELNKLCIAELIQFHSNFNEYPNKDYTKSWYLGAITTISSKIEHATLEAREQVLRSAWSIEQKDLINSALVVIDSKIERAKTWVQNNLDAEIKNEPLSKPDAKGYAAGQVAAEKINIDPNQKALE
jgi:hypothetical protein